LGAGVLELAFVEIMSYGCGINCLIWEVATMIAPQLAVKDVDAAVEFYTKKLGFKHDFSMPGPDGKNAFAWVSWGDTTAFGLSLVTDLEHRGNGVTFMVYVPEGMDIDTYYADVEKNGVNIVEPIKDQYWGDRTFTVHDPDGYVIIPTRVVKMVSMEEAMAVMRGEKSP
jgi:PhnB protein